MLRSKKGDTLIEVLLAVGIFSMIAISVVAVMSGGTSEAQLALETTLAREEIDAQAEALRYVHDSYINDKNSNNENLPTIALWRKITNLDPNAGPVNVYVPKDSDDDINILQYTPSQCPTDISSEPVGNYAFILDTRQLNAGAAAYKSAKDDRGKEEQNRVFTQTLTYPRLVFNSDDNSSLISDAPANDFLRRAEGIYVVAVADKETTVLYDIDGNTTKAESDPAFFDFYIRTCWYGNDTDTPSTISTVIRLHNPDVSTGTVVFDFCVSNSDDCTTTTKRRKESETFKTEPDKTEWPTPSQDTETWAFRGWCRKDKIVGGYQAGDGVSWINGVCPEEYLVPVGGNLVTDQEGQTFQMVRLYSHISYTIKYDSNGSSWTRNDQICYKDPTSFGDEEGCVVETSDITRSGYKFGGWCTGNVDIVSGTCSGTTYHKGDIIPVPSGFDSDRKVTLKAIWSERNEEIKIHTTWTSNYDYDSYLRLQNPNGSGFISAGWWTTSTETTVTVSGQSRALATGAGDGRGSYNGKYFEDFTINTLGGKDYYYSIRNFTDFGNIDDTITVTVSGPYLGTRTFYSRNHPSGVCKFWNVFAYKDGTIVDRNTCTSSEQYGY